MDIASEEWGTNPLYCVDCALPLASVKLGAIFLECWCAEMQQTHSRANDSSHSLRLTSSSAMAIHDFFLYLAVILISARVASEVASHFGIPAVIGELLAGLVLGPSVLG